MSSEYVLLTPTVDRKTSRVVLYLPMLMSCRTKRKVKAKGRVRVRSTVFVDDGVSTHRDDEEL